MSEELLFRWSPWTRMTSWDKRRIKAAVSLVSISVDGKETSVQSQRCIGVACKYFGPREDLHGELFLLGPNPDLDPNLAFSLSVLCWRDSTFLPWAKHGTPFDPAAQGHSQRLAAEERIIRATNLSPLELLASIAEEGT